MYLTPQTHPDGTIHTPSSSPVTELSGSHPHLLPPLPVTECGKLNKEAADKLKKKFNIPSVDLQYDSISTMMAARLATSLVSHVLFLKNQVPLPIVQLSRMPLGDPNSRATKRRTELTTAMDTLSSHLQTTFVALSTALCQRKTRDSPEATKLIDGPSSRPPAQVHMAIVLGSSVGSAKAKVMLVLDGLEVKLWGIREDLQNDVNQGPILDQDDEEDDSEESEGADTDSEPGQHADSDDESEQSVPSSDPESEDEEQYHDCLDHCSLPASSPSPPPCSRTRSPSPPAPSPLQNPSRSPVPRSVLTISTRVPSRTPSRETSPVPSHEEIQKSLTAADRLLSRTLASACAEDGGGLSSELAPTQTHILLRAPRRFSHSSWVPRQNLTRSLETTLRSFLEEAIIPDITTLDSSKPKKHTRVGVRTEGVRIGCRHECSDPVYDTEDEEDEMIWWAWDGKIVGFSDW